MLMEPSGGFVGIREGANHIYQWARVDRYLADGSPDPSFTGTTIDGMAWMSAARQPDGKYLIAGNVQAYYFYGRILRLNHDGTPDNGSAADSTPGDGAFADDGEFNGPGTATPPDDQSGVRGVVVAATGRITAAGYQHSPREPTLWRLDPAGTPLGSPVASPLANTEASLLLHQGRPLLASVTESSGGIYAQLAQVRDDGSADPDFGNGGVATVPLVANATDLRPRFAVDSADRILIATPGSCAGCVSVTRVTPTGQADHVFDHDGTAVVKLDNSFYFGDVIADGRNGAIVMGTAISRSGRRVFTLARFDDRGHRDRGFGSGGVARAGFDIDVYSPVAGLTPEGKILVAGSTSYPYEDLALARFIGPRVLH
jgi:uncharacterized delta-60 repeat protein